MREIAEMLKVYDVKRLPVMQGDRMVGIVSRSDLVRAMATQTPKPTMGESVGGLLSVQGHDANGCSAGRSTCLRAPGGG